MQEPYNYFLKNLKKFWILLFDLGFLFYLTRDLGLPVRRVYSSRNQGKPGTFSMVEFEPQVLFIRNLDPFLMLDEFEGSGKEGAGFPDHPHRYNCN